MNFEFAKLINPELQKFDFQNAICIAETSLKEIPSSEFHSVLGLSFINQVESLTEWVGTFHNKMKMKMDVKAFFLSMNEFDINTKFWYINGYAYDYDGGLEDTEWLCDVTRDTMTSSQFILNGFKLLQKAFKSVKLKNDDLQNSRDWCEQIIIARYMELVRNAHLRAKHRKLGWGLIPVYFTIHGYDFTLKSEN